MVHRARRAWIGAAAVLAALRLCSPEGHAAQPASNDSERRFALEVWPVLQARCFPCHGPEADEPDGGLRLSTLSQTLAGGDSGQPVLVPDQPDASRLFVAVTRRDPDLAMPPKENDRLSPVQVEAIRAWIAGGAAWPSPERIRELAASPEQPPGVRVATSGGLSTEWSNRQYEPSNLWAYRPLPSARVPTAAIGAQHPIDAFLSATLAERGLPPAPAADRRTLIRRATFDLIGLPPTPEEIECFLADPDSDEVALARLVDRLLESPAYGEQWGRHWLDVVRYADSAGLANDYIRGNAWRYRDYVVRSFNADKPYATFVREQLAGDEIDPSNPELLVAVGFLRMGPWELTGMEVAKVARQKFLDDVTETVGQVFLAHPLQCARCHDHKFDPVPTRDYYRIQAAFATTQVTERLAPFLPSENTAHFEERKYLEARRDRYRAMLDEIEARHTAAAKEWCAARGLPYVTRADGLRRGLPESDLPPAHVGLEARDLGLERIARKGLEQLGWESDRYEPIATSVYSGLTPRLHGIYAPLRMPQDPTQGEQESTHILAGGDPFAAGEVVSPGVLSAVAAINVGAEEDFGVNSHSGASSLPGGVTGRRLELANWIANPDNPLPARVMVNRIWQGHFGRGIAENSNNFGATGQKPTHPELLDWLAVEFLRRGGSVKAIQRLILSSATYRRASVHPDPELIRRLDPTNKYLSYFPPRRLAAEELRDALLAVSGELNREVGGIPVRPELEAEVAFQPRQVMGTFAPSWEPSPQPGQRHRRSLYIQRLRGLREPFLEVFDQPHPDSSCERRETSTVVSQALGMFHRQATRTHALAFAIRLMREASTPDAAIQRAFQLAFARSPTAAESRLCLEHWRTMTQRHQDPPPRAAPSPREVLHDAVEENTGERFQYVETLDSAPDFVPDTSLADVTPEVRGLMEVCLVLLNTNEFLHVD